MNSRECRCRRSAGRRQPQSAVSPTSSEALKGPELHGRNPSDSDPFNVSGRQDSNLRPLGPEAGSLPSTASSGVQPLATIQVSEGAPDNGVRSGRSGTLGRVTPVVPNSRRGLRVAGPGPEALLTVRETARRLRVSTATVYLLCEQGELPHLRVSNAIRVRREDLEAFIGRGGRP